MTPVTPPDLNIPPSPSTVSVSAIDTTSRIYGVHTDHFLDPPIEGHGRLAGPAYSFLIQHPKLGRRLLFDLGIRKDFENLARPIAEILRQKPVPRVVVDKDVRQILEENNVDPASIEAVVWSHHHFDHTGDPSRFDPETKLIVGPGFSEAMLPGYPANPESTILQTDYEGRELHELDFEGGNGGRYKTLKIGRFGALDYFGDGSLYLLDSPGHAVGHLCALARVSASADGTGKSSFVFLAGDAFHHAGEIRPSEYLPIPERIEPSPFSPLGCCGSSCPGSIFDKILRREGHPEETGAFYGAPRTNSLHHDLDETIVTFGKLQEADCRDEVLMCAAHDESLLEVVDFFPNATLDNFSEKGWVKQARWRFLSDFGRAVGMDCPTRCRTGSASRAARCSTGSWPAPWDPSWC
ncbi:beta-lactamase-like protein [Cladorrhinum samala]|uniref:Beta-lactamase-like protein n=1 Tax=Cladorrhinum samala TaxID=585594 RepID=A0AAV9HS50_9PEZI|nr:beta-lactamase-like protein [Cladorrhinum samala]